MNREQLLAVARPGAFAAVCGLAVAALSLSAGIGLTVLALVSLLSIPLFGFGFAMFPVVMAMVRYTANLHRRLARAAGVVIPEPYRPVPPEAAFGTWARFRHTVGDPAVWRDFAWLIPGTLVGALTGLLAAVLPVYGLEGLLGVPLLTRWLGVWYGYGFFWPITNWAEAVVCVPLGGVLLFAGLAGSRWLMWLNASFARLFLAPTRSALLLQRVKQLSHTRSQVLDSQAAELRRLERDLHDGAQARIVALGMSLGLAEELMDRDPETAARLLAEARRTSGEALTELRSLVRGIHPPVLAERGLAGAVEALALTVPIPVRLDLRVPPGIAAPIESAAYFTVAEILANIVRHSDATQAELRISHQAAAGPGKLTMVVRDNGRGGADPRTGTGLRGIERRLAAFDGRMELHSPVGGPTVITMELPCALSSPRISPSSGTD